MIFVCGPQTRVPFGATVINVTSRSDDFGIGLSPFHLGPCDLYGGHVSENVENGWQYSKVYKKHTKDGEPTEEYWQWAKDGWNRKYADRYPMGKGAIPEYSLWDGQKLGYVQARKRIYYPLYARAVEDTDAFKQLKALHKDTNDKFTDLWLWDFDGFNHREFGMTLQDVIDRPERKMGHAFVLAGMLTKSPSLEI